MNMEPNNIQFPQLISILKQIIQIPKQNPKKFYQITLNLLFPITFSILAHSLFTTPIVTRLLYPTAPFSQQTGEWVKLIFFQFIYIVFFFTVASIYSNKPVFFTATGSGVCGRLLHTFIPVSILAVKYSLVTMILIASIIITVNTDSPFFLFMLLVLALGYSLYGHVFFIAQWQLAGVVSVYEPNVYEYGFGAIKRSYELRARLGLMPGVLAFGYLLICGVVNGVFARVVVYGESTSIIVRVLVGGFLVGVLVVVNSVVWLAQSTFYQFCKRFDHQGT